MKLLGNINELTLLRNGTRHIVFVKSVNAESVFYLRRHLHQSCKQHNADSDSAYDSLGKTQVTTKLKFFIAFY